MKISNYKTKSKPQMKFSSAFYFENKILSASLNNRITVLELLYNGFQKE